MSLDSWDAFTGSLPGNTEEDLESLLLCSRRTLFNEGLDIALPSAITRRNAVEAQVETLIQQELTRHMQESSPWDPSLAASQTTLEDSITSWLNSEGMALLAGEESEKSEEESGECRFVEMFAENLKREVEAEVAASESSEANVPFLQTPMDVEPVPVVSNLKPQGEPKPRQRRTPSKKQKSAPTTPSRKRKRTPKQQTSSASSSTPSPSGRGRRVRIRNQQITTTTTFQTGTEGDLPSNLGPQRSSSLQLVPHSDQQELQDEDGMPVVVEEAALKTTMRRFASKLEPPMKWKPTNHDLDCLDLGGGLQFVKRIYRKVDLTAEEGLPRCISAKSK